MTYRRQLVIMVKEPIAGRVKTRLGREFGVAAATSFYRHNLNAVTLRMSRDPRWQTELSVAPAAAMTSAGLPPNIPRVPQAGADLGERMQRILARPQVGPVIVIGTDIPAIAPGHIAEAFRALGRHDVVFGPAEDGGFWLVGMRRCPRLYQVFRDVRWSSPDTLRDCLNGLSRHPIVSVGLVETLSDADDARDLQVMRPIIGRRILPKLSSEQLSFPAEQVSSE